MSRRTSATPLLDRLAELDGTVAAARRRLTELEQERTASARKLAAARGPLDAYYEEVGAGDRQPDPAEEARLLAAVRDAGSHVRLEVAGNLRSGQAELVAVDDRAERLVAGARRAVETAEAAVVAFQRVERAGLAGELTTLAEAARAAQEAALPALTAAVEHDRRVRAGWRRLLRANAQPDTLPTSPLRGFDDDVIAAGGTVPLAIPASLRDTVAA